MTAAVTAAAVGHLVAAVSIPSASPVVAVSTAVIDLTPAPVKQWAINIFGTGDKTVLVGSVLAVALILAAIGGALAARRFVAGVLVLVVLVAAAGVAALRRPDASAASLLPSVATLAVAFGVLWFLIGRPNPTAPGSSARRAFVVGAGASLAVAAVSAGAGRWIVSRSRTFTNVVLPPPAHPIAALPHGLSIKGISAFRTPTKDFYRVDVNLLVPNINPAKWELTIDGDVRRPLTISFDELLAMPMIERDVTLQCVSNEIGGEYVGSTRWLGVPVRDLLDRVGVGTRSDQILSTAIDGFTVSTPLAAAQDGRDMMVAVGMDGHPLPREHGFPARLITPGLYGYVGATKWLTRMNLTTYAAHQAYWTQRQWAIDGPIKIASRIDTPLLADAITPGRRVVAGVAWAPRHGVGKVEVRVDDGPWQQARLGPSAGVDYWRQWYLPWDATSGDHSLSVRATTLDGELQTKKQVGPFPDGASEWESVRVKVS